MSSFLLALRLAVRNVGAHAVKNLIVGVILVFGTVIVVSGGALLDSLDTAMRRSITTSVTGDLQVFDKDARDTLAMLGDMNFGGSDNGEVPDFQAVKTALANTPEVAEVLPMGIGNATVFGANDIDRTLDDLRVALRDANAARQTTLIERIQRICSDIRPELDRVESITSDKEKVAEDRASLDRVIAPAFAAEFLADPIGTIDWMDGHIAALATDSRLAYFRLLGTDLPAFARTFPRFEITRGGPVPAGERGIVLNESMVEQWLKNPIAREFDALDKEVNQNSGSIGTSGVWFDRVARMSRQYRRILYQLDSEESAALLPLLQAELKATGSEMIPLLKAFLSVTDETLVRRKQFFYDNIGPRIRLYDINVGDTLPLRAFTKSGYLKSLNVKVYGVYRYKGVTNDDSSAGAYCLLDMPSFRELYGKMTDAQREELAEIKVSVGAKEVDPASSIEDQLFGGGGEIEATATEDSTLATLDTMTFGRVEDRVQHAFTQEQIDNGLATNIAVILKDPSQGAQGLIATQAALDKAGLNLQVIDWRAASGLVGQAATVVQLVLFVAVGVLFLVAMVIINNALVMATLERTGEIGTMRAIGAQRGFVRLMFVLETGIVGLASGVVGAGLSAALISWLHTAGIPAGNDFLSILFGGKAMYPELHASNVALGLGLVTVVSTIATIYPAILASSVPPVVALQGKE